MKKFLLSLFTILIPLLSFAQEQVENIEPEGFDQKIDRVFGNATGWFVEFIFYQIPFSENVSIYWVLFPLILGAGFFTIYFRFVNFT